MLFVVFLSSSVIFLNAGIHCNIFSSAEKMGTDDSSLTLNFAAYVPSASSFAAKYQGSLNLISSKVPSAKPTTRKSIVPSTKPSFLSSKAPSFVPTTRKSIVPSTKPSLLSSKAPSFVPTTRKSMVPSTKPSLLSSKAPSFVPTTRKSIVPSTKPSLLSSKAPSFVPTTTKSMVPSTKPSLLSSKAPSFVPTTTKSMVPSTKPSLLSSKAPSSVPTTKRITLSALPSLLSSKSPSFAPTTKKSIVPSPIPTRFMMSSLPSRSPSSISTKPSNFPTRSAASPASFLPTGSRNPTNRPSPYSIDTLLFVSTTTPYPGGGNLNSKRRPTVSPTGSGSPGQDITYHNNQSVMTGTVQVYNIFLGDYSSAVSKNSTFLVNNLASKLGSTSWYNILSNHYYQFQNGVKTYISKSLVFNRHVVWQQASVTAVTERHFIQVIIDKFNTAELPLDGNGIYAIFFRGNIANNPILNINGVQKSWLTHWCGYHGAFRLRGISTVIKFAVVGDPTSSSMDPIVASTCYVSTTGSSPNGNMGGDSMANLFANQIANVVTNPTSSTWYMSGQATYSEVATICSSMFRTFSGNVNVVLGGKTYLLQQLWIPKVGCALSA